MVTPILQMRTLRLTCEVTGPSSHNELGSLALTGSDLPSAVDRWAFTPAGSRMMPAVLAAETKRAACSRQGKRYVAKVGWTTLGSL